MFRRLAGAVVAHPWWVIGAWVVAAALLLGLSPQLVHFTSNNNTSFLPSSYESVQAQQVAARYFPSTSGAAGTIVVSTNDGKPLSTADQQEVASLATALSADEIPSVASVTTAPQYLSPDKKVQLVRVVFTGQPGAPGPNAAVPVVREKTDAYLAGSGLRGGLTGNAAISVDSTKAFDNAETTIAIATVVLIIVLLGLVFRSVLIALLPIVVIGVVHQMAQALTADLADWFGFVVGPELAPLLVVVMFGVGTDYIVFLMFRYRERMAGGDHATAALRFSLERVGKVIASAAATVTAAFAALLVASLESLKTLAPGLIVAILLMLAAALTLVPAILTLLGRHVFWPTPPRLKHSQRRTRSEILASVVVRHPAVTLCVWSAVLVGLAFGLLTFKTTYNQLAELPASTPSRQAYVTMASAFPAGYLGPTQVYVVSSSSASLDENQVNALGASMGTVAGVSRVLPPQFTSGNGQAVFQVLLTANPYSTTAMDTVAGPLSRAAPQNAIRGATVYIGGTTAQLTDVRTALRSDIAHVFPLALAIVAIILAVLLQALVAPLYLLVGVVATYAATLGVISLVFLPGLGFDGLDFTIPIVVYLFVMAIGTDYNILIAARLREGFDEGLAPGAASRQAIVHGAPAVGAAALILAGTFASLLLTGIELLEEIGLAVALGVLMAANVLATRIVPTVAALRGWRFWWPHRRHRLTAAETGDLLPAGGHTGSSDGPPVTASEHRRNWSSTRRS